MCHQLLVELEHELLRRIRLLLSRRQYYRHYIQHIGHLLDIHYRPNLVRAHLNGHCMLYHFLLFQYMFLFDELWLMMNQDYYMSQMHANKHDLLQYHRPRHENNLRLQKCRHLLYVRLPLMQLSYFLQHAR